MMAETIEGPGERSFGPDRWKRVAQYISGDDDLCDFRSTEIVLDVVQGNGANKPVPVEDIKIGGPDEGDLQFG